MDIGRRIKSKRKEFKLTQQELAEKSNISRSYLSDLENGRYNPSIETLTDIVKVLGMDIEAFFNDDISERAHRINVYGSIPAGIPIEAIEDIIGWEEIPKDWLKGGKEYIALIVEGDSMYPKYLDGDTIIVRLQPDCETGEDCVCYVNGYDATLKRVKKDVNTITLQPLNPNYPPQTYSHPGEVTILGVVKELRRKI